MALERTIGIRSDARHVSGPGSGNEESVDRGNRGNRGIWRPGLLDALERLIDWWEMRR